MKILLFILLILFLSPPSYSQEIEYLEYSYTEFFKLIEEEQDTVFQLSDAFILFNRQTDSLFSLASERIEQLVIDKKIVLNNVHFQMLSFRAREGVIFNVLFKKDVDINGSTSAYFRNCVFEGYFHSNTSRNLVEVDKLWNNPRKLFYLTRSQFHKGVEIAYENTGLEPFEAQVALYNNEIWLDTIFQFTNTFASNTGSIPNAFSVYGNNISAITLEGNVFHNRAPVDISCSKTESVRIHSNNFDESFVELYLTENDQIFLEIEDNTINKAVLLRIDKFDPSYNIQWKQFTNKIISYNSWQWFDPDHQGHSSSAEKYANPTDSLLEAFHNSFKIENTKWYNAELWQLGRFYDHYKSKYVQEDANQVYVEMKDMETERLKYLNKLNPTFDNFFTLKINQFLKVFSAYGTRPSKAIIFSLYVILFFALIYLFFPNSWDSHGKNRLIDRYTFFTKYMRKDAGIHEVYQDEKKAEMLSYEQFRSFMKSSEQEIPGFFTATAFPLYKWAVSGTKLSTAFLKRIDIMKGTWSEVPKSKRWWKGMLLIGAFTIAIAYDIIIKMLNALMLSINTFTTLGFGEIPIKGLPRYLAIIQGFIGWFMLTIFSVSLISQLLN